MPIQHFELIILVQQMLAEVFSVPDCLFLFWCILALIQCSSSIKRRAHDLREPLKKVALSLLMRRDLYKMHILSQASAFKTFLTFVLA